MSLVMLCFPCCVDEQPPPRRRPKIDRNMIGEPMGFKHTGHIGSGEVSTGFDIHNVQDQMQSKGGYEYSCNLSTTEPEGVDLSAHDTKDNGVTDTHESDQSHATEVRQEEAQVIEAAESQGTKENEIHVTLNEEHGTKDDSQESSRTPEQNQL